MLNLHLVFGVYLERLKRKYLPKVGIAGINDARTLVKHRPILAGTNSRSYQNKYTAIYRWIFYCAYIGISFQNCYRIEQWGSGLFFSLAHNEKHSFRMIIDSNKNIFKAFFSLWSHKASQESWHRSNVQVLIALRYITPLNPAECT